MHYRYTAVAGFLAATAIAAAACGDGGGRSRPAATITPAAQAAAVDMTNASSGAVPPVKGYVDGQEIRFIHTEASDPKVAIMLTSMMGSPVIAVPSLALAPAAALANVYVFTNGVRDHGPFGFQPDVFDSPPGSDGYSPLRRLNLVTWKDARSPRELKSADDVRAAEASGDMIIEQPGTVVNMPMLTWPGGQR